MRIDARHAAVADGCEKHGHHGEENRGNHMTARLVVDNAEAGHGGGGLDEDDAVEDEIAGAQTALEAGGFDHWLEVRHQFPWAAAVPACGVSVEGATFEPSTHKAGSPGGVAA